MTYTIYVDVLFLMNLVIDYLIIASTAFISGREYSTRRMLLASACGAAYSVAVFFPQLGILNVLLLKITISIVIVFIAFRFINIYAHIKLVFTYYIINFIYGGGMYAFYRFTSLGSKMNFSNGEYYIDMPLWLIITLAIGFYFMIKLLGKLISERGMTEQQLDIRISLGSRHVDITALIDTGNTLRDPISMLPVMLVEKNVTDRLIMQSIDETVFKKHSMRLIPYSDASGNADTVYAFKPTSITVKDTDRQLNEMLIGIVDRQLTPDASYQALLHSKTFLKG